MDKQMFKNILFIVCLYTLTSPSLRAQSLNSSLSGIKINKKTTSNADEPFSVQDVVHLVRFFMEQEGIERCESDLYSRQLKLVASTGINLYALLTSSKLQNKLEQLGYTINLSQLEAVNKQTPSKLKTEASTNPNMPSSTVPSDLPKITTNSKKDLLEKAKAMSAKQKNTTAATPPSQTNNKNAGTKPDCTDCGEVIVNDSLKESILNNSNYGGTQLIIDLPNNNADNNLNKNPMNQHQLDSLRQILFKKMPK